MTNVIDLMPYIENKRAMENFEKAEIETKQAIADGINSFSFQDEQFLRSVVEENRKQLGIEVKEKDCNDE